ncbi:hypothetical protein LX15_004680 [Streptoalloteichus tenebrarius]|uniref:Uncharacterized protein n=1 Tax=Streptoalloteichus tenebrarius (strain ATCC 17920 / DSM 40477 / JCM 4838 / CBS 697.72 / NBRC 16177 / NCIMB 11028 / NRRL B-12390 / A12253. 1 / ISP 5477) TaxID=1933 RepID=A0ABT1I021_STRSD|nr:hypothetical protein [Streptoalloteichus tenebrarius]MCP2260960.1 hypothetical protein [Streptoalloteichus tenebrarius]
MELAVTVHHARLGPRQFTVIRPRRPLTRAVLIDRDRHLDVLLDQNAARCVGGLWELAASSPRSLVHLPLRGNATPPLDPTEDAPRQLDLVLLHHSLQFAPSRWKEMRARLGAGRPRTVTVPATGRPVGSVIGVDERHYRENRDLIDEQVHAETLFLTGSAKVFRETSGRFFDIALHGFAHVRAHPRNPHYCTEFHSTEGVLGNAREIHVQYCEQWRS